MWQWQNNNGSADPALTPTTEGVDMLSMLGKPALSHAPLSLQTGPSSIFLSKPVSSTLSYLFFDQIIFMDVRQNWTAVKKNLLCQKKNCIFRAVEYLPIGAVVEARP
jgi:hypothetical protein